MGSCASRILKKMDGSVEQINYDGKDGSVEQINYAVKDGSVEQINYDGNLSGNSDNLVQPRGEVELREVTEEEIIFKLKSFKQFDVAIDHSDHHFTNPKVLKQIRAGKNQSSKTWAKRIQDEWKILEKNLPEMIYVRIYEDRMEILRAVIVGSAGTPYHDGLFFFDVYFPHDYPNSPPLVHYHSGGLRLNPNLYESGKVCLSLLNTWEGSGCEKWSQKSTMLQVLISIQGLVLNARPYFNEPGFAATANTPHGEKFCLVYNEKTFLLSCKTMLYALRNPPKHFEEFVAGHFYMQGGSILKACRNYMAGAQVGCHPDTAAMHLGYNNTSSRFMTQLGQLFPELVKEFSLKGVDCTDFLVCDVQASAPAEAADSSPEL